MPDDGAYIGICPGCKKVVAVKLCDPDDAKEMAEFAADLIMRGRRVQNISEYEISGLDIGRCACGKDEA